MATRTGHRRADPGSSPAKGDDMNHDWTIETVVLNASAGSFGNLAQTPMRVVAICSGCGLIRTQLVPGPKHERHIDLRGTCPGEPQAPEDSEIAASPGAAVLGA
jgi:hypothetical protein